MFPANFDYHRPGSVAEAVALLGRFGGDAKILAGGHTLVSMMKLRLAEPANLIDVNGINDMKGIREEDGEICIAGPQVMTGYWDKPEETKDTFVGKYFRTGDVGHMDDEGFTFIIDRLKDMINASGFKIYPRLHAHLS